MAELQEEPKNNRSQPIRRSRFQEAVNNADGMEAISPERQLETKIGIEGMAPSDLQVAAFIESLGSSTLFENVALIESKEEKNKDKAKFRRFKLSAELKKEVHLSSSDIDYIRSKCNRLMPNNL